MDRKPAIITGMNTSRKLIVSFTFIGVFFYLPGCHSKEKVSALKASGTLEMTESYLSFPMSGRVADIFVREGDDVKAGQLLATTTRRAQAQRDLDRMQKLLSSGGATREQSEKAELALQDQEIRAPMQGIVLMKNNEPGEVVSPGTPVLVIGNPKDVYMHVYFSEEDIGRIQLGQPAKVFIDSFPEKPFTGKVTYFSPKAEFTPKNIQTREERVTLLFEVKITLDAPDGLAKPGLPADCEL